MNNITFKEVTIMLKTADRVIIERETMTYKFKKVGKRWEGVSKNSLYDSILAMNRLDGFIRKIFEFSEKTQLPVTIKLYSGVIERIYNTLTDDVIIGRFKKHLNIIDEL